MIYFFLGASSGIGAGTAICFATLGCKLSLTGRNAVNLDKTSLDCVNAGADKANVRNFTFVSLPIHIKSIKVLLC